MYVQVEKPKENKSRAVVNSVTQKKSDSKRGFGFIDNRPESKMQNEILGKIAASNHWNDISPINDFSRNSCVQLVSWAIGNSQVKDYLLRKKIQVSDDTISFLNKQLESNPPYTWRMVPGTVRLLAWSGQYLTMRTKLNDYRGVGEMGRFSDENNAADPAQEAFGLRRGQTVSGISTVVSAEDGIPKIIDRESYQGQGESAGIKSGRIDAEWLHCQGHGIGGTNENDNVMAGPHCLNTLMIAFESFMKTFQVQRNTVDYSVKFYKVQKGHQPNWVDTMEIMLINTTNGNQFTRTYSDPYGDKAPEKFRLKKLAYDQLESDIWLWAANQGFVQGQEK